MAHPAVAVLEYHLVGYRRTWRSTVFSSFATPLLLFVGLGAAVGAFVDRGGLLEVPYLKFIAPGMLAFTGMQIAMLESGFPVQNYMQWDKVYHGMAAAPPRVVDMIAGQLLYISLRVVVAAGAFLLVMLPFGAIASGWALLTPLTAVLVGLAVATPMFAYSATTTGPYVMAIIRFATLPMMFFSGVFFPVEQLPGTLQPFAYPLPLWHGVQLCRAATLGSATAWPVAAHISILSLWSAAGFALAHRQFAKRLTT